eukprot:Rhum_TRINITY_DN8192_c0_g1::Rhum_TRINITY_DN8192_c0_g1_i1::g.26621::m.26621
MEYIRFVLQWGYGGEIVKKKLSSLDGARLCIRALPHTGHLLLLCVLLGTPPRRNRHRRRRRRRRRRLRRLVRRHLDALHAAQLEEPCRREGLVARHNQRLAQLRKAQGARAGLQLHAPHPAAVLAAERVRDAAARRRRHARRLPRARVAERDDAGVVGGEAVGPRRHRRRYLALPARAPPAQLSVQRAHGRVARRAGARRVRDQLRQDREPRGVVVGPSRLRQRQRVAVPSLVVGSVALQRLPRQQPAAAPLRRRLRGGGGGGGGGGGSGGGGVGAARRQIRVHKALLCEHPLQVPRHRAEPAERRLVEAGGDGESLGRRCSVVAAAGAARCNEGGVSPCLQTCCDAETHRVRQGRRRTRPAQGTCAVFGVEKAEPRGLRRSRRRRIRRLLLVGVKHRPHRRRRSLQLRRLLLRSRARQEDGRRREGRRSAVRAVRPVTRPGRRRFRSVAQRRHAFHNVPDREEACARPSRHLLVEVLRRRQGNVKGPTGCQTGDAGAVVSAGPPGRRGVRGPRPLRLRRSIVVAQACRLHDEAGDDAGDGAAGPGFVLNEAAHDVRRRPCAEPHGHAGTGAVGPATVGKAWVAKRKLEEGGWRGCGDGGEGGWAGGAAAVTCL